MHENLMFQDWLYKDVEDEKVEEALLLLEPIIDALNKIETNRYLGICTIMCFDKF